MQEFLVKKLILKLRQNLKIYVKINFFESVFFDAPRYLSRINTLNKYLDKTYGKISKNLDLSCLKSKDSARKPPQK